jgi:hypothetical protein
VSYSSSHCHSRTGRERLVRSLQEAGLPVSVFGGGGCLASSGADGAGGGAGGGADGGGGGGGGGAQHSTAGRERERRAREEEELRSYKFALVLETNACADFVTEKLYFALARGQVPVYLGAPNVADFAPAIDSFIDARAFASAPALAAHLRALDADDARYERLHAWRARPLATYGVALRRALAELVPLGNATFANAPSRDEQQRLLARLQEQQLPPSEARAAAAAANVAHDVEGAWARCGLCYALDRAARRDAPARLRPAPVPPLARCAGGLADVGEGGAWTWTNETASAWAPGDA